MIVVSLGANLSQPDRTALGSLEAAIETLVSRRIGIAARSQWYRSAPVPFSDQPDYINGAVLVNADLDPWQLLVLLHEVEAVFGRKRAERWASRTLDLDLIDYRGFITLNGWRGGRLSEPAAGELCLPHPRAHERAFVLRPLGEIAPAWQHPLLGKSAEALLEGPPSRQRCEPMGETAANRPAGCDNSARTRGSTSRS